MPTNSIALCTYNGARFLAEQLESIASQTRLPDELVICDDCSSDETAQIVKRFAETCGFTVRFCINEKNLGSTRNFEKAIELCNGEIIFLCDQDDFWEPTKIEKIVAEFKRDARIGLVFSDAEIVDEGLQKLNIKLSDLTFTPEIRRTIETKSFLQILLLRNYITGATMAFKSEFRREFLPLPLDIPEMIHDAWIVFVIIANSKFKFVDETLIKYRQHSSQQLGIIVNDNDSKTARKHFQKWFDVHISEQKRIRKILDEIERRENLIQNAEQIKSFANELLDELDLKIRHYETRKNMPSQRLKRFTPVAKELFSVRYHKLSKGFLSALKDLTQNFD